MKCPQCKNKQGYKQLTEKIWYFICPVCGYKTLMKRYRGEIEQLSTNNS